MFNRLIALLLVISYLNACSPSPGWKPSTVAQQVRHAGAVIYGVVDSVNKDINSNSYYIHLVNAYFFKGCGPIYVRINGFTSSAACGLDPPKIGNRVIVFVCREKPHWTLNVINLHTGMVPATRSNIITVNRLTSRYTNCDRCRVRYFRCTKPIRPVPLDVDKFTTAT